jgi:hypothetical protein
MWWRLTNYWLPIIQTGRRNEDLEIQKCVRCFWICQMSGFWLFNCLVDSCLYTLPFFYVCLFVWWCLMPLSLVLLCFHVYQSVKTVSLGFMFAVQWSKLTMCRCWNSGLISLKACWIWVCLTLFESYIQQPFNPSITIYYFIKKNERGLHGYWLIYMKTQQYQWKWH